MQPRQRLGLPLLLFALTCVTTTLAGAAYARDLAGGLYFSVPLLAILVTHEAGHYVAARLHGVESSLPYFIPLPPPIGLFGTMGAIITMPRASRDPSQTLDIGAAGPLAGLVVAIPVLAWGIAQSPVQPVEPGAFLEGNSLLYLGMKYAIHGQVLPSGNLDINLHPTALAGWAGLFVTMINLLPVGQLDGGHVAAGLFGNRWEKAARLLHVFLLPLWATVVFAYIHGQGEALPPGLRLELAVQAASFPLVWMLLLAVMRRMGGRRYHPPLDDLPLRRGRRALGVVTFVALLLILMPWPMRRHVPEEAPAAAGPGYDR